MPILGSIIKRTIDIRGKIPHWRNPYRLQVKMLRKLLTKAQNTAFGQHYKFDKILLEDDTVAAFKNSVPVHDYNSMFKNWWYRALNGESYVCWPGKIKYFALSSGTSEASSKHIPVTREMIKAIQKGSIRQVFAMAHYNLPKEHFERGILMIGGSTHLNYNGTYYEGDLSGITTGTIPFWFQHFYKPGPRISSYKDWNTKLDEMTKNAKNWDIGIVLGVPAWIQILFERILDYYKVETIHDIWPNLLIYVHGGVNVGPYKKSLEKMCKFPLIFSDTYLASEGLIAFQERPNELQAMRMSLDNGLFFEFAPFTEENFDSNGTVKTNPKTYSINEVKEDEEYALILSSCSGAWRYLIGDTIKFTDIKRSEIVITGRTKHYLSLCGEHLSVENMTKAVKLTADELGIEMNEFTVAGIPHQNLFAHHWYVGTNKKVDPNVLREKIDNHLKVLNDDYRVERDAALKEVIVTVLPDETFIDFMASRGTVGGAFKFPRVMKGKIFEDWKEFIEKHKK
jgi:hypothetical protein